MIAYMLGLFIGLMRTPEGILLGIALVVFLGYRFLYKPYERCYPYSRF
jgi:hypothetical protein